MFYVVIEGEPDSQEGYEDPAEAWAAAQAQSESRNKPTAMVWYDVDPAEKKWIAYVTPVRGIDFPVGTTTLEQALAAAGVVES